MINGIEFHFYNCGSGCFKLNNNLEKEACPYYEEACKFSLEEKDCTIAITSDIYNLLKDYHSALKSMVYQCCVVDKQFLKGRDCDMPNQEVFFNSYISAGEEAFRVLGIENGQEVPEDWLEKE